MKSSLLLLAVSLSLVSCHASADDALAAKLRALFPKADVDHNETLSSEEQAQAVEFVKKSYGDQWSRQIEGMLSSAAAADKSVSSESWLKQVAEYTRPIEKKTEKLAMRDGIKLATDIYMPRGAGPFPVILARTPYNRTKHNDSAPNFAAGGYVFVNQDMRGRFESEGENIPFIGCGWGEHQDGVDTVAWIKQQPWCNGCIGTIGGSAGGITQNLLAGAAPGALKAQYISVAPADMYSEGSYIGSASARPTWKTGSTATSSIPRRCPSTMTIPPTMPTGAGMI